MAGRAQVNGDQDVEEELWRLSQEPLGTARSVAVERLVRRIEAEGPGELLAHGYAILVRSYVWGREVEKAFVPFTRWLRHFDERPDLFSSEDQENLFWSFRWMVSRCMDFPQVPFEQVESTLADMERRFALAGLAMDAVRLDQFRWAWLRSAPETEELFWAWVHTPRDEDDTCPACDAAGEAHYLAATGRAAEAVRRLEKALDDDLSCESEPAGFMSQLAEYYLELGRPADAVRAYRACVSHLERTSVVSTDLRGRLALFLARGGQPHLAVRRIEADERFLLEADTPADSMYFLTHVAAAARLVALRHPDLPVRLAHVPASTATELAAWARERAHELAVAFDSRNRGDELASELAKELSFELAPEPLDLAVIPVRAVGDPTPTTADPGDVAPATSGRGEKPGARAQHLVDTADRHVRRGELLEAAPLYLEAVTEFRDAGELTDAGLAEANAARCAHKLEDVPGADAAYRHAVGVLRAAGAAPTLVSSVVRSWVPLAHDAGSSVQALEVLAAVRAELAALGEDEQDDGSRKELAESLDTHARALASLGEHAQAAALAEQAAERFAALGLVFDAAQAFWLVGRVLVSAGRDADALHHLESAVEGLGIARKREQRGKAATDLVDALRRLGRDQDADEIVSGLG